MEQKTFVPNPGMNVALRVGYPGQPSNLRTVLIIDESYFTTAQNQFHNAALTTIQEQRKTLFYPEYG